VAEWPNVPDSKSGVPQGTVGSNPTSSSSQLVNTRLLARFSFLPTNLPAIEFDYFLGEERCLSLAFHSHQQSAARLPICSAQRLSPLDLLRPLVPPPRFAEWVPPRTVAPSLAQTTGKFMKTGLAVCCVVPLKLGGIQHPLNMVEEDAAGELELNAQEKTELPMDASKTRVNGRFNALVQATAERLARTPTKCRAESPPMVDSDNTRIAVSSVESQVRIFRNFLVSSDVLLNS
jgi:hypothetical protein